MASYSKQKGASFEREICKRLSLWLTDGTRRDLFWRSAMSGGRATIGIRKGQKHAAQAGDITAIDPLGNALTDHFVIECKFYRNLALDRMVYKGGVLLQSWRTLRWQARPYDKMPMLIAKQNGRATLLCLTDRGYKWLASQLTSATWHKDLKFVERRAYFTYADMCVCLLDALLLDFSPTGTLLLQGKGAR